MRVPIVDIGNSKGIRIPQAILKQVQFAGEIEMDVSEGKITLRRTVDPAFVPDFASIAKLDDPSVQRILRKVSGADLITALVGADRKTKETIFRNLSERARSYVQAAVSRLEKGDARDILIERSRNAFCEALMEIAKE
jgi:flagellar motor switch protein FliG